MSLIRTRWAAIGAAVAVTLGAGGFAAVSATAPTGASTFVPITPCRLFDTRPDAKYNKGPRNTPIKAGETWAVQVTGSNGNCKNIPAEATGVAMNLTADLPSELTFLTVWPEGETRPDSSSLNPTPGHPSPNEVNTRLGPSGKIQIYSDKGSTNILADVTGYYIDHNHDDRYYTKAQIDAKIPGNTVTPTGTSVISISSADFVSMGAGTAVHGSMADLTPGAWLAPGAGSSGLEAMIAGVELPQGATVTGMTVEFINKVPTTQNRPLSVGLNCESLGKYYDVVPIAGFDNTDSKWVLSKVPLGKPNIPAPSGLTIDNQACSYYVYAAAQGWSSADQTQNPLKIGSVHITVKMP